MRGAPFFVKAEENARMALKLAPDDPRVLAYASLTIAWCGKINEAIPLAKKAVDISPSYAEGLAYYGDALTHSSNPEEGISYLSEAIRLTPYADEASMYYLMKGEAEIHMGQFDSAVKSLGEAKRLADPTYTLMLLAGAQLLADDREAAETTFREMTQGSGYETTNVQDQIDIMNHWTVDGGGKHFKALWAQLLRLETEVSSSP
jgi:tetratricopeptide (TPR) repeat protein